MRTLALLLIACLPLACGDSTTNRTDGGLDLAGADLAGGPPDLAGADLTGEKPDLAGADLSGIDLTPPPGGCVRDNDCRLFDGHCSDMPCFCYALSNSQPNPPCTGQMVSCIVEPCTGKVARCIGGNCYAQ